jgi:hypothetical protein
MRKPFAAVRESEGGPSRHIAPPRDLGRFSNRPLEVKHFQTIRHRVMASLRPRWIYRQRPC